ncbi:exo-beta-1,3-glucanase [Mycena filopes]|nr:exo-beta-1,3-glucanase [Mycena filopes]
MLLPTLLLTLGAALPLVSALGSSCTTPLGAGTAAAGDAFWMQDIKHQGIAAFNSDPSSYQVFRNVMDFGAKGDGVTDDAAASPAIKYLLPFLTFAPISKNFKQFGYNRWKSLRTCHMQLFNDTLRPLFTSPKGLVPTATLRTYLVGNSIIAYYYTQLIGDAASPPTLLASASFSDFAVIGELQALGSENADPYIPGGAGAQWYTNQNNFFRSVRNFVIDTTRVAATSSSGTGIHWQVSQSTSLMNIVFNLSTASDTAHQAHSLASGIWMENGSGGFMGDLIVNGGKFGLWVGNQQFTVRNVTISNAQTAILGSWNWGWTFQNLNIKNCGVSFERILDNYCAHFGTGRIRFVDGFYRHCSGRRSRSYYRCNVSDTPIFVRTSTASSGSLINAGSLVLNNIKLTNVPTAVGVVGGAVVLAGGTMTIDSVGTRKCGTIPAPSKPDVLLDSAGKIFGRPRPQYAGYAVNQFVSVRDQGAKGDGKTDDTAALQAIFDAYAGCKIIFFDAGTYVVTSTLKVPAGAQVVGEAWSVIAGKGSAFQDVANPKAVVQVGAAGSSGIVEITDIIFSTIGSTPGAIVVEWNVKETTQGGPESAGTEMQVGTCSTSGATFPTCAAAFLALHITASATAYLEGTWVWLADHDLDDTLQSQISLFSGRGILSESAGPVWLIGTGAEHHSLYQYNLQSASNHWMGLIQTETPYYQPSPEPTAHFPVDADFKDPSFDGVSAAFGLVVADSSDILVFGAGLYSFYSNYDQTCLTSESCQSQMLNIDSKSSISIYSLQTVGTAFQLSIAGAGIIKQDSNLNGFAATVTSWTR